MSIELPAWIDSDYAENFNDEQWLVDLAHGGCASGQYMPAVTYYTARVTMAEHGDDVLQFIEDSYGELPAVPQGESWSGIAVFYLSIAVEQFGQRAIEELANINAGQDECEWCNEPADEDDLTDVEDVDFPQRKSGVPLTWRLCACCIANDVLAD